MTNILNMTLAQIARLIDGKVEGDPSMVVTGISGIKEAKKGDITFLANARYYPLLRTTKASAIIVDKKTDKNGRPVIRTDDPYIGFVKIMEYLQINKEMPLPGIHKTAVIGKHQCNPAKRDHSRTMPVTSKDISCFVFGIHWLLT